MADMSFGLCDMNRLCAPLAPVKVGWGGGKWQPVKIITNNTLENLVFGKTEINNKSLDDV